MLFLFVVRICCWYLLFIFVVCICCFYLLFVYVVSICCFYLLFVSVVSICCFYLLFVSVVGICCLYLLFVSVVCIWCLYLLFIFVGEVGGGEEVRRWGDEEWVSKRWIFLLRCVWIKLFLGNFGGGKARRSIYIYIYIFIDFFFVLDYIFNAKVKLSALVKCIIVIFGLTKKKIINFFLIQFLKVLTVIDREFSKMERVVLEDTHININDI